MDPTRINTTTITSPNINDIRYYPINPMATPLICNVATAATTDTLGRVCGTGATNTLQSATITSASGSLLQVIPLQMTTLGHNRTTSTNPMNAVSVMPQMTIINTTTGELVGAVGQTNSSLDYYQLRPQMQSTVPLKAFNVLVKDTSTFIRNPGFVEGQATRDETVEGGAVVKIGNVSQQPTETSAGGTFILPTATTTSNVPTLSEVLVKQIVTDNLIPSAATSSRGTNVSAIIKGQQQQLQLKTQLNKIQAAINSSLYKPNPAVTSKPYTTTSRMISNHYDSNCLDKSVGGFAYQSVGCTSSSENRPTPFSINTNSVTTTKSAAASTFVTKISNSVTLSIVPQTQISTKKAPESAEMAACTILEKSIPAKENKKLKRPKICKAAMNQNTTVVMKQESLLKSKPLLRIVVENTSPRTKRSKSLSSVVRSEDVATERRRSTASEGKVTLPRSPEKQATIAPINIEEKLNKKPEGDNNKCTEEKAIFNECIEFEEEYLEETEEPTDECLLSEDTVKTKVEPENIPIHNGEQKMGEMPHLKITTSDQNDQLKPLHAESKLPTTDQSKEKQSLCSEISLLKIKEEPQLEDDDESVLLKPEEVVTQSADQPDQKPLNKSLFCDEHILITSSSSTSASSSSVNNSMYDPAIGRIPNPNSPTASVTSASRGHSIKTPTPSDINSYSTVLEMLSTFNMLSWKERIGTARNTNLRFQLNEFNLLQIYERCPPRYSIHTAYEKPIYERETHSLDNKDPLLYLCRRCNCHGPAAEFLAPEFCSVECLKRDSRKRQRDIAGITTRKRPRKEAPVAAPVKHQQQHHTFTPSAQSTSSILVKKFFRWSTYLTEKFGEVAAPVDLFLNPFPTGPNRFQIGMKLEAIDPENCSLFCVCTVTDIQGYRLNLTFDGYDQMYNFWVNADSMDIFPPGWCAKTNRILQPPLGIEASTFNWPAYFAREKSIAAPRQLFTHLNSSASPMRNPFKIGMHLEAEDLNDTGKLCVATVSDVLDDRIRIHFNGWDDCYDYWVDICSPYIHPCGWHEGRQQLIAPPDFEDSAFSWPEYVRERGTGSMAPVSAFSARDPIDFKPKMKLEVVDPRNPLLIRPATIVARKGHRIKLHLDLWPSEYCFWLEDDSPDLHPIGWCDASGHDLEPPPGYQTRAVLMTCSITGCRGIGNAKFHNLSTHSTLDSCPYAPENWSVKLEKAPRVGNHQIERKTTAKAAAHLEQQNILNKPRNESLRARRSNEQKYITTKVTTPKLEEHQSLLDTGKTKNSTTPQEQPQISQQQQQIDYPEEGSLEKLFEIKQEFNAAMAENTTDDTSSIASKSKADASSIANSSDTSTSDAFSLRIAKEYLCDYGPRLQQNYNIWQQNLNWNYDDIKKNPMHWSTAESSLFVEKLLKCSKTAHIFTSEDIDGTALLLLQQSDLTDILNLTLGKAVKLYAHILQLRNWTVTKFNVKMIERI